jgi:hypothetical protein
MSGFKKPLIFSLAVLPVSVAGAYFTALYEIELFSAETLETAIEQVGSKAMLIAGIMVETVLLLFLCSFFGYILSNKVGLWKPISFEKEKLRRVLPMTIFLGVLFSLDYWTFGNSLPAIKDSYSALISVNGILCEILYGGILEEVMLRLFVMSLISFIIWKIFFRKLPKEQIPASVFIFSNIISALLFAAGHLPATITYFGTLTTMIVFRCFLLNGAFGIWFGYLYRKEGISYSMLVHALVHIVSDLIWVVFI